MSEFSYKKPNMDKIQQAIQDTVIKTGLRIEQLAKETAPVDTGNYRSQINYDGSNTVIANANYSADIEYGTQAHEIKPVNAKALHFKKNGKDVFSMKANIPARSPKPVMRNAAAQTQKEIPKIWKDALRENNV